MYQFERSSTNASKERVTAGVHERSYASVASATSCAVRATSQRSSGCSEENGDSRSAYDGAKPWMFAYGTKNPPTEFQNGRSRRLISLAGVYPNLTPCVGGCSQYIQRMTSAPIRSSASCASIVLPFELCISCPCSSRTSSCPSTSLYGARPSSMTDMKSSE